MSVTLNLNDTEIFIHSENGISFSLWEIHDYLINLGFELLEKIDKEYYLHHSFEDIEYGFKIDSEGGYIEDLNIILHVDKIKIDSNHLTVNFRSEVSFKLFFEITGYAYDGTDREWVAHGGSTEKIFNLSIFLDGNANKVINANDLFTIILEAEPDYPPLNNAVTTTELFEIDDAVLLRLISDGSVCPLKNFNQSMEMIEDELDLIDKSSNKFAKKVMLHGHIITILEAYLMVRLCKLIFNQNNLENKLISNRDKFRRIEKKEDLLNNSFHNVRFVNNLLKLVFDIDIKSTHDLPWLQDAVKIRHDCVHRAGYDKDGNKVLLSKESLQNLADSVRDFVTRLDSMLAFPYR